MARILSLDDVPHHMKKSLSEALRPTDEAKLLPSAYLDTKSGKWENVVFRLDASEREVPSTIFSPCWGEGVSAIKVSGKWVNDILSEPSVRHEALRKLREAIPSQSADSAVLCGCDLDGDDNDRDVSEWTAGFDGHACFVGLYSAEHSCAPDPTLRGRNRCHSTSYLVVKAGAGQAACKFHSRFMAELQKGSSLNETFDAPGMSAALRRVTRAGTRNRSRILMLASEALGAPIIDSVPDQSSCGRYRSAVTQVDVNVNVLRKVEDRNAGNVFQYSTCVDATVSTGLMSLSNLSDGVVLFLSEGGDVRQTLRNDAHSTLPYSSPRLMSDAELIGQVAKEHKAALKHADHANIDAAFIRDRFTWKNRQFAPTDVDVEPLALWGSHNHESFFARFARELGVAQCQVVRLRPCAVCVAGVDQGKLRAAQRSIKT